MNGSYETPQAVLSTPPALDPFKALVDAGIVDYSPFVGAFIIEDLDGFKAAIS